VSLKAKKSLIKISIATLFLLASVNFAWINTAIAAESEKTFLASKNVNVPERLFLSIEINTRTVNGIFYAEQFADGRLVLAEDAWVASNLTLSGTKFLMANDQFGFDINNLQGIHYVLDSRTQSIKIKAPGKSFGLTDLSKQKTTADIANNSPPGAYLNYNLTSTATKGEQDSKSYGAFIEGIVFNQYGSVVSSAVTSVTNGQSRTIRAETYFQKDMPSSMEKLIIGDTISSAGAWSRPMRFGGVAWSTDFSLKQGFISAMTPSINGSATLPSTVDILIDNQKRQSDAVNPGPFQINNFPTVTGAGQINVVVKDMLGVQTLTTQRFYTTPRLLKVGLNEFSLEAGIERRNFGLESNTYDKPFIAETFRRGFNGYTVESRTEIQADRQAAGIEIAGLIKTYAVTHAALAASNAQNQQGLHKVFGIERSSKDLNINFKIEHYDRDFVQIGAIKNETKPRQKMLLGLGINFYRNLWVSTNLISQTNWNSSQFNLAFANLSIPLIENISLNLYVNKQFGNNQDYSAGLNINMPFSNARSAAVSSTQNAQGNIYSGMEVNQAIVNGTGVGYRLRAGNDPAQQVLASISAKTPVNSITLDAGQSQFGSSLRLSSSGSIGILGGLPFASQNIGHGSFAVVKVADEANIDIYQSNRKIASTNSNGLALLPNVLPYQQNKVSIKPENLPFDLDVNETSQLVTPYARSGLFVSLDIKKTNNRLVRLLKADGTPLPMGSKVHVLPANTDFVVAKRGEVYLTGLSIENTMLVAFQENTCSANLSAPMKSADKNTIIMVTCR
jgi:outer membrane usher protein